jgi:hypothetical protein
MKDIFGHYYKIKIQITKNQVYWWNWNLNSKIGFTKTPGSYQQS